LKTLAVVVLVAVLGVALIVAIARPAEPTTGSLGSLGATCYVIASDARSEVRSFAQVLQDGGHAVWVCDGTDDQEEIAAAINTGAGKIVLSEGTFNISDQIIPDRRDSYTLEGYGRSTLIKAAVAEMGWMVVLEGDGIVVRDLSLDGDSTTNETHGLLLKDSTNFVIERIHVTRVSRGIYVNDSHHGIVHGNLVEGTVSPEPSANSAISVGAQQYEVPGSSHVTVSDNIVDNCYRGIRLCNAYQVTVVGNVISNITEPHNRRGLILCCGEDQIAVGNYISGANIDIGNYYIEAKRIIVANNIVDKDIRAIGGHGDWDLPASDVIIQGNICRNIRLVKEMVGWTENNYRFAIKDNKVSGDIEIDAQNIDTVVSGNEVGGTIIDNGTNTVIRGHSSP